MSKKTRKAVAVAYAVLKVLLSVGATTAYWYATSGHESTWLVAIVAGFSFGIWIVNDLDDALF